MFPRGFELVYDNDNAVVFGTSPTERTFAAFDATPSIERVISSIVADPKTAANIVPFVLIPQIIMGGAMIKFEDMNRNLGLVYSFSRWFHEHPNSDETTKMDSRLQVPFICEFVAMRWSYEEMVVAQAKLNPLTKRQEEAQKQIDAIVARHESNANDSKRLDDLKETLAVLSGLEAHSSREIALIWRRSSPRRVARHRRRPHTAQRIHRADCRHPRSTWTSSCTQRTERRGRRRPARRAIGLAWETHEQARDQLSQPTPECKCP